MIYGEKMNIIKGIYKDGKIELFENPFFNEPMEVVVIFPENKKKITKIGGTFKKAKIDYKLIEADLKNLSENSENHLLEKFKDF
jgi:hypothetical protein